MGEGINMNEIMDYIFRISAYLVINTNIVFVIIFIGLLPLYVFLLIF